MIASWRQLFFSSLNIPVLSFCWLLQVAFVEMPNFNFDLTLYGGDIGFLPGLEAWITAVIKDSVLRCVCKGRAEVTIASSMYLWLQVYVVASCCVGVSHQSMSVHACVSVLPIHE